MELDGFCPFALKPKVDKRGIETVVPPDFGNLPGIVLGPNDGPALGVNEASLPSKGKEGKG
jgi:hypothetical protein